MFYRLKSFVAFFKMQLFSKLKIIIITQQLKHFLLSLESKRIAKSNFFQKWSLFKLFPKDMIVFTFLQKMGALILQHFPS